MIRALSRRAAIDTPHVEREVTDQNFRGLVDEHSWVPHYVYSLRNDTTSTYPTTTMPGIHIRIREAIDAWVHGIIFHPIADNMCNDDYIRYQRCRACFVYPLALRIGFTFEEILRADVALEQNLLPFLTDVIQKHEVKGFAHWTKSVKSRAAPSHFMLCNLLDACYPGWICYMMSSIYF